VVSGQRRVRGRPLRRRPRTPTVRTNHQPYVAGENYTAVIDGYVVSPHVGVRAVETFDLSFRHSEHQPVMLEVSVP
jgi:hypothetical protein